MPRRCSRSRARPRILTHGLVALLLLVFGAAGVGAGERDCPDCFLDGEVFDLEDLSYVNLARASLYRASFRSADLSGADLTETNLQRANFVGADLTDALLVGADMTGAEMTDAITLGAVTVESTICPDGTAGPCDFGGGES